MRPFLREGHHNENFGFECVKKPKDISDKK
jgi:hypothetical protein